MTSFSNKPYYLLSVQYQETVSSSCPQKEPSPQCYFYQLTQPAIISKTNRNNPCYRLSGGDFLNQYIKSSSILLHLSHPEYLTKYLERFFIKINNEPLSLKGTSQESGLCMLKLGKLQHFGTMS